jgi:glutathione S-transferase
VDIAHFPALEAWEKKMEERPAVQKGRDVPTPHTIKELVKDPKRMQEHAERSRQWVQAGMAEDAKKLAATSK